MSEIGSPENTPSSIRKAPPETKPASSPIGSPQVDAPKLHDAGDKKALKAIRGDLARFNLNLTGQNEPWQPTAESGLPQAPEHTPSAELAEELKTPIKVEDPKTGQKFNTLQLNWKQREGAPDGQRVLVFLPPFNNKIDEGATHYRIQELARQSGVPVLAIDHPSMGASDELTPEQRESLTGKEGYGKIAEAELRVMEELGITEIDLVGQSMGAFAAAELAKKAAEYGIKVKNLILVETPGVKKFFNELHMGMKLGAEGKYLDIYTDHPEDPQQSEAAGGPLDLKQQVEIVTEGLKPDARKYGKAMAKRTSYSTIKDTLSANDELKVTVVNGTLSGVSPAKENREMIAELGKGGYGDRVRHMVFQGEPHTVMESAKRFGAITKLIVSPPKAA